MASQAFYDRVDDLASRLRHRRVAGSLEAAKLTAELLRQLVTSSKLNDPHALLLEVKEVGSRLQAAEPTELVIGNITRRVLHIVREELDAEQETLEEEFESTLQISKDNTPAAMGGLSKAFRSPYGNRTVSLHTLLDQEPEDSVAASSDLPTPSHQHGEGQRLQPERSEGSERRKQSAPWARKQEVIDGVNELIEELKDIDSAIANQALEHVHSNEVILTFGYSRTVLQFLKRAGEKRHFQVVVSEASPTLGGHRMARELAAAGIQTTLIADSAVYALMERVNKVVVTAHALLADGGVMAPIGMQLVAMAAKRHVVPFVVLVGIYKLSPLFPHEPGLSFNELKSPAAILTRDDPVVQGAELAEISEADFGLGDSPNSTLDDDRHSTAVRAYNPSFDYVDPSLISLFVTDQGPGFMPSYVYRQLFEWYHRADW